MIDISVEGTRGLIDAIIHRDVKKDATFSSYEENKSLASAHINLTPEINQFRPADIRKFLPDKVKRIAPADLTRAHTSSIRIQRFSLPIEEYPRRQRGHPKTYDTINTSITGPKSYYRVSNFELKLNHLFSKREAVELIYHRLCELDLIFRLEKYVQLWIYHNMRKYDLDRAWNRCRSVFLLPREDFDIAYRQISSLSEANLDARAEMIVKKNLSLRPAKRFIGLFRLGARSFHSRIKT